MASEAIAERAVDAGDGWLRIRAAYAEGDLPLCETLLNALPGTDLTRLWRIRLAGRRSEWGEVRDLALAYLALQPTNVEVAQALARAANKLKDVPLAAASWRRVADIAPDPAEALRQSARANAKIGNDVVALAAVRRLAAMAEARPESIMIAARALLDLDQFDALARLVEDVAAARPEPIEAFVEQLAHDDDWRGLAIVSAGLAGADSHVPAPIDAAIVTESLLSRAVLRERDGALGDAFGDFRATLVLSPAEALARRGVVRLKATLLEESRALSRIGAFGEAIAGLRTLYRADPANRDIAIPFGRALMNAEAIEPALDLWRDIVADDPDREEAAIQVARALTSLDRSVDALAAWSAVLDRWPANEEATRQRRKLSQSVYKLGREALAADDTIAAATYLMAVPADAPEGPGAAERRERTGRIILRGMRADYKTRDYSALVRAGLTGREVAPENADLHRLLAKGAAKLRSHDIALESWERVATLQDSAEARTEIERLRAMLGDASEGDDDRL